MQAEFSSGILGNICSFLMVLIIWPLICVGGLRQFLGTSGRFATEPKGDAQQDLCFVFAALDTQHVGRLDPQVIRTELLRQGRLSEEDIDAVLRDAGQGDADGMLDYRRVASLT